MDWVIGQLEHISGFALSHLRGVSFALMTSLVALYGGRINRQIQRYLRTSPFLIKTGAFVLVCAFGYGWLGTQLAEWLSHGLRRIPRLFLSPTLLLLFLGLGLLAQKERQL